MLFLGVIILGYFDEIYIEETGEIKDGEYIIETLYRLVEAENTLEAKDKLKAYVNSQNFEYYINNIHIESYDAYRVIK